jgi:hypothetical protein
MKDTMNETDGMDAATDAKEQLDLITALVQDSRSALRENGFPYILWGGISSAGTLLSYLAAGLSREECIMPLWLILTSAGGIAMAVHYGRAAKPKVRHVAERIYGTLWLCIAAGGLGLWLIAMIFHTPYGIQEGLAVLSVLIGIGYVVSGVITNYRTLFALGILWMAGGGACLAVPARWTPALLGSMAFLFEFVPGLVMYIHAKKQSGHQGQFGR